MSESQQDAYGRGEIAGAINARLADHDKHFAAINGHLADIARELTIMSLAIQRLGDQAVSRDATVITTAAALKDAEEARRNQSERSWSPWSKVFAVLAGIATVIGIILAIRGWS